MAGAALDALHAPSDVARTLAGMTVQPPPDAVRQAMRDEAGLRWRRVELRGEAVARLTRLRRESRAEVSEERRQELFGFNRVGLQQLGREVASVRIAVLHRAT